MARSCIDAKLPSAGDVYQREDGHNVAACSLSGPGHLIIILLNFKPLYLHAYKVVIAKARFINNIQVCVWHF